MVQAPPMRLVRVADGAVLAEDFRVADSFLSRLRGLMGRGRLGAGEALWIEPCDSIHMMFMRFAIDVLFVHHTGWSSPAGEGEVLKVCSRVRPWIGLAWCRGASGALEIEAGRAAALGVAVGDRLRLEEGRS